MQTYFHEDFFQTFYQQKIQGESGFIVQEDLSREISSKVSCDFVSRELFISRKLLLIYMSS